MSLHSLRPPHQDCDHYSVVTIINPIPASFLNPWLLETARNPRTHAQCKTEFGISMCPAATQDFRLNLQTLAPENSLMSSCFAEGRTKKETDLAFPRTQEESEVCVLEESTQEAHTVTQPS